MATIKDTMLKRVDDVRTGMNSLRTSHYGDAFFWQELSSLADKKLKEAWAVLQGAKASARVNDDDTLRALGAGDHVLDRTKRFVCMAKVTEPRKGLDEALLVATLAKKYKLDPVAVAAVIAACKVPGKPALSKRILEGGSV